MFAPEQSERSKKSMNDIEKIALHPNKLRRYSEEEYLKQKEIFEKLENVFEKLEDIPYAMVKGQILSQIAYGAVGYRKSHDIDLLVEKKDVERIDDFLCASGFKNGVYDKNGNFRELTRREKIMYLNSHQTAPYIKWDTVRNQKIEIDINTAIWGGEMRNDDKYTAEFLRDTIDVKIMGYRVKTLNRYKAFIHLVLHHYREMNAPYIFRICNPINTKMFEDIYMFYIREIKDEIKTLYNISSQFGTNEYLYYMFFYTNIAFRDKDIEDAANLFYSENGEELLDCYGLNDKERKKWKNSFTERLDMEDIYSVIVNDLNSKEKEKIETIWSIIE